MKINVDRSFLEINSISDLNRSKSPGSNFKISEVDPPDFHLNKFFYKQIGRKHRWIDRLTWGDKKWIEYVENPKIKTFILRDNNNLVGYYETIHDFDHNHSEIAYFGILEEYFKHAKSAFIGKSLSRKLIHDSGQNPISAARMNCKIYHGPYVYNFEEIYEILKKNNISKKIENYEELSNNLIQDLESIEKKDNKFKNTMDSLGEKTLSDTIKNIEKFIFDEI